jgi:hypothetical protein
VSTQVRERAAQTDVRRVRVTRLPFGLSAAEVLAALGAAILLIGAIAYYLSSLGPEQDKLRAREAELAEQKRIMIATATPGGSDEASNVADQAKEALESLEAFKGNHLKPFSSGRIALIKEINALAKKNGLLLTSGIDMGADADQLKSEGDQTAEKDASKRKNANQMLNVFPNVNFRFAVFGQYANLRTFISQLEREKQFLVINSINLANQESRATSRRSGADGVSGIVVTIEMTAYFQPAV